MNRCELRRTARNKGVEKSQNIYMSCTINKEEMSANCVEYIGIKRKAKRKRSITTQLSKLFYPSKFPC